MRGRCRHTLTRCDGLLLRCVLRRWHLGRVHPLAEVHR